MPTFSKGNTKTGNVITYSRTPGDTCPGASDLCASICYAKRPYRRYSQTRAQWDANASVTDIPTLPLGPATIRLHVSGDFDTAEYVLAWYFALRARPDVLAWTYTRSWRVPELLPYLEKLRGLPNVQMFASTDQTITETPPDGWRVAFIDGDDRYSGITCPEQTGVKASCAECGICFIGKRGNVRFLKH